MDAQQQEALTGQPSGLRRRVWCRGCRRELTDRESRLRGWGRECDPDQRTGHDHCRGVCLCRYWQASNETTAAAEEN